VSVRQFCIPQVNRVLQEAVVVALIGAALAFTANALSPRGLKLSRNYFPATRLVAPAPSAGANGTAAIVPGTNSPRERLSAQLRENGLQLADSNKVIQLFRDPRREQEGIIFIDARDDEQYGAGHIPGAYQFYHFQPEKYLTNVVQVCLTAEQMVFYCSGGECDVSVQAAVTLRDIIRIPREKLFVYDGGFAEWATNGLPIELGTRNSGQFTNLVQSAAGAKGGALTQ
jgi:rhodanese-related sulfurtransferase